jgi:allophanate hydrolase subunit 2
MVGPDEFPAATVERLVSTTWEVGPSSNRIGVRLQADEPLAVPHLDMTSRGMITGAIQLPPDGRPIVLLNDHATVGGYPVIATVVSADLGVVGQLRPGDTVRFEPVELRAAVQAQGARLRALDDAVVGWYPVRAD